LGVVGDSLDGSHSRGKSDQKEPNNRMKSKGRASGDGLWGVHPLSSLARHR
jgi:hypothetical protein